MVGVGWVGGWVGGVVLLLGRGGAAQGAALDRKLPAFVFCPGARARRRFMDAGLLVGRWWWVLVGRAVVGGVFFLGAGASSKMQGPWRLCSDRASTPGGASLRQGLFGISWWVDELTG